MLAGSGAVTVELGVGTRLKLFVDGHPDSPKAEGAVGP